VAPAAEPRPSAGHGHVWQGLIGVAVSIVFLGWALHRVSFTEVLRNVRHADPLWFAASVVAATLTFPLRALRWRIFLSSSTPNRQLKPYWRAVAIGFMANNILPARAGEVVRAYAGTELIGVPFPSSLASIGVERIFDGVILVFFLAIAVASPTFPTDAMVGRTSVAGLARTMAVLFAGALVVLIIMVRNKDRALPLVNRVLGRLLPERFATPAMRVLAHLVQGLGVLHSSHDMARVVIWTLALWGTNAASYVFGFLAFGIELPHGAAFVLQSVAAFGVAIPAAPGFFGVFEKIAQSVLGIYGVSATLAFSFAIAIHMGWFVPITIIGLVELARSGLTLRQLRGGAPIPAAPAAP
jgi:glycosyltransferase 2 family protein